MSQSKKITVKVERTSIASAEDNEESCAELKEMLSKVQIQQEAIAKQLKEIASSSIVQNSCEFQQLKSLAMNLPLFEYPSETFDEWYWKYGGVFKDDTTPLSDRAKVQLLLSRLGESEIKKCTRNGRITDMPFREMVRELMSLFAKTKSRAIRRLQYLQLEKEENEDLISYGLRVDKAFCAAEMEDIHPNELKCLMFVSGFNSPKEAELQKWLIVTMDRCVPEMPLSYLQRMHTYYMEKIFPKLESLPEPITEAKQAWRTVHLDFFHMQQAHFVVLFDAYSHWAEVYMALDSKAATIVSCLKCAFSRFGLPATLILSCETCSSQVKSKSFIAFCKDNDIFYTSVYHSSQADYSVFKDELELVLEEHSTSWECTKKAIEVFLSEHINQSFDGAPDNKTPAELMKGRRMRLKENASPQCATT